MSGKHSESQIPNLFQWIMLQGLTEIHALKKLKKIDFWCRIGDLIEVKFLDSIHPRIGIVRINRSNRFEIAHH